MSNTDYDLLDRLQTYLEGHGVDVIRVGTDLCMPSPFKEREKRKIDPHYVDAQRRLWVTAIENEKESQLIWQCWYSKKPNGSNFGGYSAYPLAIILKKSQEEILDALGIRYNKEAMAAETLLDKAIAVANSSRKTVAKKANVVIHDREVPTTLIPLFQGETGYGDEMVRARGIPSEIVKQYGICWDHSQNAVFLPWKDNNGKITYWLWYNPDASAKGYQFPSREDGYTSKGDTIFGLEQWKPGKPLVLAEGCWTAISVLGCALGGSTLTDKQRDTIVAINPSTIILALDPDGAGIRGSMAISSTLKFLLPKTRIIAIWPPDKKDWNELTKKVGFESAYRVFLTKVREEIVTTPLVSFARQLLA